jgi:hypothetical protein
MSMIFLTVVRAVGMRNKNRAVNRTNRVVSRWHRFDKFGLILFTAFFIRDRSGKSGNRSINRGNGW